MSCHYPTKHRAFDSFMDVEIHPMMDVSSAELIIGTLTLLRTVVKGINGRHREALLL